MSEKNFEALDTDDVAALLGVSDRMVRNYVKDKGLPCKGDGRSRLFVWRDVLEWYVQYRLEMAGSRGNEQQAPEGDEGETLDQALCRKTIAEADLKELQLAKERALVVSVADVERNIADVGKSIQTKILGFPTKLVGRVFGMKDRNALKAVLDSEARQICQELVQLGQIEKSEGGGEDEDA